MKTRQLLLALCLSLFTFIGLHAQVVKVVNNNVGVGYTNPTYKMQVNGDVYGQWIRSTGQRGLYAQSYGLYLQALSTNYWASRSDRGLIIRNRAGTTRGYVYHSNANGFGLLDGDGNWSIRMERDNYTRFSINNIIRMTIFANGRTEIPNGGDASGATNTGHIEVANTLRIDGNEMITNTNSALYLQNDNNGDLYVDGGSLHVDASLNRVYVRSLYDKDNGSYYINPSSISRVAFMYPLSDNAGRCGSSASTWGYGYFNRLYRTYEYALSDRRSKENIENISGALNKIMRLKGQRYQYKPEYVNETAAGVDANNDQANVAFEKIMGKQPMVSNEDHKAIEGEEGPDGIFESTVVSPEKLDLTQYDENTDAATERDKARSQNIPVSLGFIAQDVLQIVPEAVDYDEVNDVYSMSYTSIIPLLVEAMKEQQLQIDKQQTEIEELKEQIKNK